MHHPSRQAVVVSCLLAVGTISGGLAVERSGCHKVDAGFWFEPVTLVSDTLGGPVTTDDLETIASVARSELSLAFDEFHISVSDRHDARYRVRVVQELRDGRLRRDFFIPAASRAVTGFGGEGAVNFSWLSSAAITYASGNTPRPALIAAIGRGIGRAAVHELAHELLPTAAIHDSTDIASYEYHSAARREQYFGDMHWDLARPLLQERTRQCRNVEGRAIDDGPRRAVRAG